MAHRPIYNIYTYRHPLPYTLDLNYEKAIASKFKCVLQFPIENFPIHRYFTLCSVFFSRLSFIRIEKFSMLTASGHISSSSSVLVSLSNAVQAAYTLISFSASFFFIVYNNIGVLLSLATGKLIISLLLLPLL